MRKKLAATAWPALNEPIREPSPRLRPHTDNLEDTGCVSLWTPRVVEQLARLHARVTEVGEPAAC